MRGIERRIAAGLNPRIESVASLFVSRWDKAVADKVPAELHNRLGIAIARRTYRAYRDAARVAALPRTRRSAARIRSVFCGPAPARRIRVRRTRSTSKRWPRPTRSIHCPKRRCAHLQSTAWSASAMPRTAATPRQRWRAFARAGIDMRRARDAAAARRCAGVREVVARTACSGSPRRAECSRAPGDGSTQRCSGRMRRSARSPARARRLRNSSTSASWSTRTTT